MSLAGWADGGLGPRMAGVATTGPQWREASGSARRTRHAATLADNGSVSRNCRNGGGSTGDLTSRTMRCLECPLCGCRRLYVLYTRHRANTIIAARICRHYQRRIDTQERVIGTEPNESASR